MRIRKEPWPFAAIGRHGCGEISVCTSTCSTWWKVLRLYYLLDILGSQDSLAAVVSMFYDSVL
jgi:hypothetical protein